MLEKMQKRSRGILSWAIVVVIAAAFAFWGVADYFGMGGGRHSVAAKVNGQPISWGAVEDLYHRMQSQVGEGISPQALKAQLRTMLIQRLALLQAISKLGFKVGDDQINQTLLSIPAFQEEGKFSKERYLSALKEFALTEAKFRAELSDEVLLGQLERGLALTNFSLPSELDRILGLVEQQRDIGYVILPKKKFQSGISVAAKEIQDHYQNHQSEFVTPEQVKVDYLALSVGDLARDVPVTSSILQSYYEQHKEMYTAPERVHARHILITLAPNQSPEAADKAAKSKAESLLAQLKSGADFESLAKTESADTGSATKGGDLGWFAKGQMVPQFEKAAFALTTPKQISDPVRTQFGYHLIQLIEHKPQEIRSYNEVKPLVEEQYQQEEAKKLLAEKSEQLAKLAFEHPNDLTPAMKQLGLTLQTSDYIRRQAGGTGTDSDIASNKEVIAAAFSDPVLKQQSNSELVTLSPDKVLVLRLKEHKKAEQQTLAQVEPKIRARLIAERADAKLKEAATALLDKLKAGANPNTTVKAEQLNWTVKRGISRRTQGLDNTLLGFAFQAPRPNEKSKQPIYKGTVLPSGDYMILTVNKVTDGDLSKMDDNTRMAYRASLSETLSQIEYTLYAAEVLSGAKIVMASE